MRCKSRVWMLAMLVMGMSAQAQPSAVCMPQDPPSVISGGVGETELQALREVESGHNLKLVFTLEGGQFVTDVDVEISGAASDHILRHRARGPWLLACLQVPIPCLWSMRPCASRAHSMSARDCAPNTSAGLPAPMMWCSSPSPAAAESASGSPRPAGR